MKDYKIVKNEQFGYKTLYPIPTQEELNEFYLDKYYESMKKNDSQSMERFINDNESSKSEVKWLETTEYEDAHLIFNQYLPNGRLLDIGCGTGEILTYMKDKGYQVVGIEPSKIAYEKAISKSLQVYNCGLHEFILKADEKFDIINMTNVLEHIPNPMETITMCKKLLKKGGVIRIKVPNDFNELQSEIVRNLHKNKWWIAIPDHINYFDFESMSNLLEYEGFKIMYKTVDFPMELFLLMGEDYQADKVLGKECHERRKSFETNVDANLRRKIYDKLADIGIGRNLIMYAILD